MLKTLFALVVTGAALLAVSVLAVGAASKTSVKTGATATAHASLVRSGKTLGRGSGKLTPGWHSLRVSVPAGVASGAATARLTLVDAAGNSRRLSEAVKVPA